MAKKSLTERMLAHTQTVEEPKYPIHEEFVPIEMKVTEVKSVDPKYKSIYPPFIPYKNHDLPPVILSSEDIQFNQNMIMNEQIRNAHMQQQATNVASPGYNAMGMNIAVPQGVAKMLGY